MKTKLQQFKERNKKRNTHLYETWAVEGYDYIVCPVSNERLSMIKSSYIEKVLGMSVTDYDATYPDIRGVCKKRKENIKTGLHEVDVETGITKYELGQIKARKKLAEFDEFGKSGYKKKGEKTRSTHMCKLDDYGRNGYSQIATSAILKGNVTKSKKGLISLDKNEFKRYKTIVLYLTEKHRKDLTTGYITGLAGKDNAWHIDHMFSILRGYQKKVSPLVIGHRNNLTMIPWRENISKHSKCSIELDALLLKCGYSVHQTTNEFNRIIQLISDDIKNNTPPNAAFLIERFYESDICR